MLIQIINYSVEGISEQELNGLCDQLAPAIAAMPGLVSKTWLANSETNTYGGVYHWQDQTSIDNFMGSQLVADFVGHPNITNVTSQVFDVMAEQSVVTRGLVKTVA
jgi:hypothetical protein